MDPTHDPQPKPAPKIIVDEDWKAQVQAEKQQHARQRQPKEAGTSQGGADAPLPPPSLALLATTLGMQAMAALGLLPDPAIGKAETRLEQARHFIDLLGVLQQKTEGNRTPEESRILEDLLHELRMGYVAVRSGAQP
jgi:hypothetical protein